MHSLEAYFSAFEAGSYWLLSEACYDQAGIKGPRSGGKSFVPGSLIIAPPLFSLTKRSKPNRIILIEQKCFVWKVQKRNLNQCQELSFTEHYFITEPTRKLCWCSVGHFPKLERNGHFSKCDWFMRQWNSPFVTANKPNKCFPLKSDPLKYKLQRAACFQLTTAHSGFGCCKTQNCVPQREARQSQGHPGGIQETTIQVHKYTVEV